VLFTSGCLAGAWAAPANIPAAGWVSRVLSGRSARVRQQHAACGAHLRSARRRRQVVAWLVNLASVIIVGSQIQMSSVKRSRVVLVHVAVGIALQIVIGIQALIALLVRPSHESPLRQSWNVTHRCTRPRARRAPLSSMHVLRLLSGSTVCVAAQVACMVCTSQ